MAVTSLSEHEQELVSQLRAEVSSIVAQHACLKQFCNDHTYVRYLRARLVLFYFMYGYVHTELLTISAVYPDSNGCRGWHLQKAAKMLKATLEW